jgi:hypothetical protein
MVALSLPAFVDCLRENQLILPSQVEEVGQLSARFPDTQTLARELLRRGWLTAYQVNQVLQGQGKDLVLGPYRLLERLGEGGMGKVFKARFTSIRDRMPLDLLALACFSVLIEALAHGKGPPP